MIKISEKTYQAKILIGRRDSRDGSIIMSGSHSVFSLYIGGKLFDSSKCSDEFMGTKQEAYLAHCKSEARYYAELMSKEAVSSYTLINGKRSRFRNGILRNSNLEIVDCLKMPEDGEQAFRETIDSKLG